MHPLIEVLLRQPQLLATHAKAYAELVLQELSQAQVQWHRRLLWQLSGVCGLGVACGLLGVAGMLWAVTPPELIRAPWVLVMLPTIFMGIGVSCLAMAQHLDMALFAQTRQQFKADIALLGAAEST